MHSKVDTLYFCFCFRDFVIVDFIFSHTFTLNLMYILNPDILSSLLYWYGADGLYVLLRPDKSKKDHKKKKNSELKTYKDEATNQSPTIPYFR